MKPWKYFIELLDGDLVKTTVKIEVLFYKIILNLRLNSGISLTRSHWKNLRERKLNLKLLFLQPRNHLQVKMMESHLLLLNKSQKKKKYLKNRQVKKKLVQKFNPFILKVWLLWRNWERSLLMKLLISLPAKEWKNLYMTRLITNSTRFLKVFEAISREYSNCYIEW